ncbi:hypothetical protein MPSEU_000957800 [Mayamaea pseudoterrestris]|nr:hypothetical protein MPSEU_000957800 [Mayamaea pseudoterrestris]
MTRQRRCCPSILLLMVVMTWAAVLMQQHALVDKVWREYTADLMTGQTVLAGSPPHDQAIVTQLLQVNSRTQAQINDKQEQQRMKQPKGNVTSPQMHFNNQPLTLVTKQLTSSSNCFNEAPRQFRNISWQFTSCQYTNLCFNVQTFQYVLAAGATSLPVALGGINPRWDVGAGYDRGSTKVKWSPNVMAAEVDQYYQLPDDVVLVPFHSFAGHNVGHLLWDDFFAIFRLLQLYNMLDEQERLQILPIRQVLEEKLYATCDIRRNKRLQCTSNFQKFLPLMNVDPMHYSSHKQVNFTGNAKSPLVCSKRAVAGLGMLTDHGKRDHGWEMHQQREGIGESVVPHMLGKGKLFWDFRLFVLRNLGLKDSEPALFIKETAPRIIFSLESSRDWDRRLTFTQQIRALEKDLAANAANIQAHTLWQMPLADQIQLAMNCHIFVTTCGGGSITATFLPRGASLLVFYNETGGFDFGSFQSNGAPARLDWDLLGNAAHLRVHWLPIGGMDTKDGLNLFVNLIRHELKVIKMLS